jgi:hypothetical protein
VIRTAVLALLLALSAPASAITIQVQQAVAGTGIAVSPAVGVGVVTFSQTNTYPSSYTVMQGLVVSSITGIGSSLAISTGTTFISSTTFLSTATFNFVTMSTLTVSNALVLASSAPLSASGAVVLSSGVTLGGPLGLGRGTSPYILLSSASFSGINVATVTLPSTGTYTSFYIRATLKNTNVTAQAFFVKMGTDTAADYYWTETNANAGGTQNTLGCNGPATYAEIMGANGVTAAQNLWTTVRIELELPVTSEAQGLFRTATDGVAGVTNNTVSSGGFTYHGGSLGSLSIFPGIYTNCTSVAPTASSLTGSLFVYGMPF